MPIDSHPSKILVADDHPVMRNGLIALLKNEWPLVTILEAVDGRQAIELFNQHHPDVAMLDFRMPYLTGFESATQILRSHRTAKIILFTVYDSMPVVTNFLSIGGRGFLTKSSGVNEILMAIKAVHKGDLFFHSDNEIAIQQWIQLRSDNGIASIKLTDRESQVVLKLSKGLTIKEIANELNLSVRTVESYKRSAIEKTNVKNTPELIEYIFRNGIA